MTIKTLEIYSSLSRGVWITTSFDKSNFIHCDYWIDEQSYIVEEEEIIQT